ncbi:MAG: hypothetical protein AB8B63_03345 [Granulosicoccus sp.]
MDQLMAIERANPGIKLSSDDQKRAIQGTLVQVGVGAVIPTGPIDFGSPTNRPSFQNQGCISQLRFQKSADDLTLLIIDGNSYSGGNLNEFREVLLDAALAMKCVSFCWDTEKNEMTMLNVHPQCCCRCEETGNG